MMGHPNAADWWAGEGGAAYLKRNRVDWRARIPFWKTIVDLTGARSVYEFGCNAAWNLSAIRRAYPDVQCHGLEVNRDAYNQARAAGFDVFLDSGGDGEPKRGTCDLTFTAGVLIHIPPADLQAFMQRVIDASAQYVLAIEYAAPEEQEIEYRGETGLLWKRPYGKLYQEMGLRLLTSWPPAHVPGFDNCTAWLLEKP